MALFGGSSSRTSANASETGQQASQDSTAQALSNLNLGQGHDTINLSSTDHGTLTKVLALTADNLEFSAGAQEAAYAYGRAALEDALYFGAGAFEATVHAAEQAGRFQEQALYAALDSNNAALSLVAEASESENKQLSEQVLYGVMGLMFLLAWKLKK